MNNQLERFILNDEAAANIRAKGLGMGLVAAFGVVATICVIIYKIYGAKKANISLPGGFKFDIVG